MEKTEVKLTEWLLEGVLLYKDNAGLLTLCSLLVVLLSMASAGLLTGHLIFGLIIIILALYDKNGNRPRVRDLFKGFKFFWSGLLFSFLWLIILAIESILVNSYVIIGQVVGFFIYLLLMTLLMFAPFLIVDQKQRPGAAIGQSRKMIMSNFKRFFLFGSIAAVAGQIGLLLCVVGILVTIPVQVGMAAVAYREVFCGVITEYATPAFTEGPIEEAPQAAAGVLAEEPRTWEISEEEMEEFEAEERAADDPKDRE